MKAINIKDASKQARLDIGTAERPIPAQNEVLIKVTAAGINRADLLQKRGLYPVPKGASDILGLEVSGIVAETNTPHLKVGDPVCALVSGGGYAEYCTAHAAHCLLVPDNIALSDAAALPEAVFTVWQNIFHKAKLKSGDTLLIHGGSSGIGTMAIQMVKYKGAHVIVTAGTDEKCAACLDLGADHAINYKQEVFEERAADITQGNGVDIILDMVGGDYTGRNIKALGFNGRLMNIAFMGGRTSEIDMAQLLTKNIALHGTTLRAQSDDIKALFATEIKEQIWPAIADGTISPVIDRTFPLADAEKAHQHMEQGQNIGKILLAV